MQFFAPNFCLCFFICFFQLWVELGANSNFVEIEKKKLTTGFDRDSKVEGWRAMSAEEEKYFWNYQICFLWINYLLFSQQSCDCAPLICKKISCISELLHRTVHVGCHVAGLFIQHSCNYLNWAFALHWAVEKIILTPSKDSWPKTKVSESSDFVMTVQNINIFLITKLCNVMVGWMFLFNMCEYHSHHI